MDRDKDWLTQPVFFVKKDTFTSLTNKEVT